eukprot:scaffold1967_cov60-Phaeocystis_antarctica.AAC.10
MSRLAKRPCPGCPPPKKVKLQTQKKGLRRRSAAPPEGRGGGKNKRLVGTPRRLSGRGEKSSCVFTYSALSSSVRLSTETSLEPGRRGV